VQKDKRKRTQKKDVKTDSPVVKSARAKNEAKVQQNQISTKQGAISFTRNCVLSEKTYQQCENEFMGMKKTAYCSAAC